jgi:FkbM family methyltransferase
LLAEKPTGVAALVNSMGMYDFHNMNLLKSCLALRPATFVDVGANIGPYTLIASEESAAYVVSVEPHPVTFAKLARNVQMNGRENVACFNLALSDHDGQVDLTDQPESSINRVVEHAKPVERFVSVPGRTLDGLCAELNINPDIVKIDVEGHEVHVIRGFQENLKKTSLLFIEGGERPEIGSVMRDNGLLGPLYFHHGEKTFLPTPQRRAEDPVYLSRSFLEELHCLGGIRWT